MDSGLDASSKAYNDLSEHLKDRTMEWLIEDQNAQKNRKTNPAAMDIYDTVKWKGKCNDCR